MTPSLSTPVGEIVRSRSLFDGGLAVHEFVVSNWLLAAWACSPVADAMAEAVAVGAVLLAEVAGVTDRTGVDGPGSTWPGSWQHAEWGGRLVTPAPGALAAGIGAEAPAADRVEEPAAAGAGDRYVIVTRRGSGGHSGGLPTGPGVAGRRDGLAGESGGGTVAGGVVGDSVLPAAPYDPDPGAGEDADGVGVVAASGPGAPVDVGDPGALMAGVVGEGAHGSPEAFVARPAEVDRFVLAGLFGHRGLAGEERVGVPSRGVTGPESPPLRWPPV